MHIDRLEKSFLQLSIITLVVFMFAIALSVFGLGVTLPGFEDQIDPQNVDSAPGFNSPGIRKVYDGKYEVFMTSQVFFFTPSEIEVPVGSEVTFFIASKDVIHGLKVYNTNINIMVIPGQISEVTQTFDEVGDYYFYCHEYCGSAHHTMAGVIHVVEQ